MAKVKFIACDMWKRGIYSFIGTLSELKDWVYSETKDEWSPEFLDMIRDLDDGKIGVASYNYDYDGCGVILMPKFPRTPKELAYAAHEILHATFIMLDYCGVEYHCKSNNETFTYLDEHLTRNVLERMGYNDYKIKGHDDKRKN